MRFDTNIPRATFQAAFDQVISEMSYNSHKARSQSLPRLFSTKMGNATGTLDKNGGRIMFLIRDPTSLISENVMCDNPGCTVSSRVADYKSMTIRTGCSWCIDHITQERALTRMPRREDLAKLTVIYYDMEINPAGEIEQLAACVSETISYDTIIRTSVRSSKNPCLSKISPEIWNIIAEEPVRAMNNFVSWTRSVHSRLTGGDRNDKNIMLVAHNGAVHDHVHLLKTMMKWGITPPNYRLSDSLSLFKVMKGKNEAAKLNVLVNKYSPWFDHTPHDACSDADALRSVIMTAFPDHQMACYTFSITCTEFMNRTGLSAYSPAPVLLMGPSSSSVIRYEPDDEVLSEYTHSSRTSAWPHVDPYRGLY